jgi:hypothetical protein
MLSNGFEKFTLRERQVLASRWRNQKSHTADANWFNYLGKLYDIIVTAKTMRQLNNLSVLQWENGQIICARLIQWNSAQP